MGKALNLLVIEDKMLTFLVKKNNNGFSFSSSITDLDFKSIFLFISKRYYAHNKSELIVEDFRLALLFIAGLTIIALLDFITLPKGIGDHVRMLNKR